MSTPLDLDAGRRYLRVVKSFTREAFRLETLQAYRSPPEDAACAAFVAGRCRPPFSAEDLEYLAEVGAARGRGARWRRVHIVREPLTDYLAYELTWEYGPNADAGEEIGLVVLGSNDPWPATLPAQHDFWLFDQELLFVLTYSPEGQWAAIEEVVDPHSVAQACQWRRAALRQSRSWEGYVAAHPGLAPRVPDGREVS